MSDSNFKVDKDNLKVITTRVLKAKPERVFAAYSDPQQIPNWWGPEKYKTVIDKFDFRVGGTWRFIQTDETGKDYAFNGVYKEINAPGKISDTFEYEPIPGHILLETVTFEAQPDGTTLLTATAKYDNLEDLEGMVSSGMESGQRESMDRLARLVEN